MIKLHESLITRCNLPWNMHRGNPCMVAIVLTGITAGLLAAIPGPCRGEDRRSPLLAKRVERVLREAARKTGDPGIAFGLVQNGSVLLECYTGLASWNDKRRVDSSSVFNWASMSKALTAVCALKMAEQGQIDLDAEVKQYIPEIGLTARVTLRQLLDQQGGIGGYDAYPELSDLKKLDRKSLTQQAILEKLAGKQTVFDPGSRQGYSSPGYILLSIAMERAAKKSFAEIVSETVAKPLKLSSLRVGGRSAADVVPYQSANGKREPIEDGNNDWRLGAGAIKSNLPDALAFASSLIESSILTPASSKELFKRRAMVKLEEGDKMQVLGVTYGFVRLGQGSDSAISSAGMQPGARSLLMIYPRQQAAAVIFANKTPLDLEKLLLEAMEEVERAVQK